MNKHEPINIRIDFYSDKEKDKELHKIISELKNNDIDVTTCDKTGHYFAAVLIPTILVYIKEIIISGITYDLIKKTILKIYNIYKDTKITKVTASKQTIENATFGVGYNNGKSIIYANFPQKNIENPDEIIDKLLLDKNIFSKDERTRYLRYDHAKNNWVDIDLRDLK